MRSSALRTCHHPQLEERRRQQHGVGLGQHVARADVRELVREDRLELGRARCAVRRPELTASVEPRGPRPTTNARGKPSSSSWSFGRLDAELRREAVGRRAEQGVLGERERSRAEHPEERPVAHCVRGARGEQRAEREQESAAGVREQPADARRTPL